MFLRVSKYDMTFPLLNMDGSETGEHALLNGLYGAVDVVSPEEAELISRSTADPSLLESFSSSRLDSLIDRGHVVLSEDQESEDLRIISRISLVLYSRRSIGLVILPTFDCNLRCVYCFERHRLGRGSEWLQQTMSDSLLDSIFNHAKALKDRGYHVGSCTLYGGEPLLADNKELVRKICDKCRDLDIGVSAVTNGADLDKFIDIIKEYKFGMLQITVDGIGELHNKRRPFSDGTGSYSRIMDNIGLALENDICISVRVNMGRSNLSSIVALPEEFRSRGFTNHSRFSYYFKAIDDDTGRDSIKDAEIFAELLRTGSSFEDAIDKESMYSTVYGAVSGWLNKNSLPALKTTHCGSETGMQLIGPDGLIFPCWDVVGKDDYAEGIVTEDRFMYNFSSARWRTRTVNNMTPCRDCRILMLCGGGCAAKSLDDLTKGTCEEYPEIFKFVAPRVLGKAKREGFKKSESKPLFNFSSKYRDDDSCLSLSVRELLGTLSPDERSTLMTTNSPKEILDILSSK